MKQCLLKRHDEDVMKKIAILGSTGSIGTQTLEVVRRNPDLKVTALAAGRNSRRLEEQIREFSPEYVAVWEEKDALSLRELVKDTGIRIGYGMDGLIEAAAYKDAQITVTAIVGMIGIRPTIEAPWLRRDILSCLLPENAA